MRFSSVFKNLKKKPAVAPNDATEQISRIKKNPTYWNSELHTLSSEGLSLPKDKIDFDF